MQERLGDWKVGDYLKEGQRELWRLRPLRREEGVTDVNGRDPPSPWFPCSVVLGNGRTDLTEQQKRERLMEYLPRPTFLFLLLPFRSATELFAAGTR